MHLAVDIAMNFALPILILILAVRVEESACDTSYCEKARSYLDNKRQKLPERRNLRRRRQRIRRESDAVDFPAYSRRSSSFYLGSIALTLSFFLTNSVWSFYGRQYYYNIPLSFVKFDAFFGKTWFSDSDDDPVLLDFRSFLLFTLLFLALLLACIYIRARKTRARYNIQDISVYSERMWDYIIDGNFVKYCKESLILKTPFEATFAWFGLILQLFLISNVSSNPGQGLS
ncbi:hypothetical protein K8I61_07240 [bacterium]|nr:hypothetical protein [bacterium]